MSTAYNPETVEKDAQEYWQTSRCFEVGFAPRAQHQLDALGGEFLGDGTTETLTRCGDQRDLVGDSEVHGSMIIKMFALRKHLDD